MTARTSGNRLITAETHVYERETRRPVSVLPPLFLLGAGAIVQGEAGEE